MPERGSAASGGVRRRWRRLRTFVLAILVAASMLFMAAGAASADAWPMNNQAAIQHHP